MISVIWYYSWRMKIKFCYSWRCKMDFFLKYIIEHYILSKRGKKKLTNLACTNWASVTKFHCCQTLRGNWARKDSSVRANQWTNARLIKIILNITGLAKYYKYLHGIKGAGVRAGARPGPALCPWRWLVVRTGTRQWGCEGNFKTLVKNLS